MVVAAELKHASTDVFVVLVGVLVAPAGVLIVVVVVAVLVLAKL